MNLPPPLGPLAYPPGIRDTDYQPPARATPSTAAPRISVVTPSFNQARFLEATIRSVLRQGYPNLDYVIIDGGSTDGSVEIIRHYAAHLSHWVSERDRGQVDAILKGLARCDGAWFNWVNSDDVLAPGALWHVAGAPGDADVFAGATDEFLGERHVRRVDNTHLSVADLLRKDNWHQPSIWLRRAALQDIGIEGSLHYRFDYLMALRYLARHPRVAHTGATLSHFRLHPESKSTALRRHFAEEKTQVLEHFQRDAAAAPVRELLDLTLRRHRWRITLDSVSQDTAAPRWSRVARLVREIGEDREARCTPSTRRALKRILLRGGKRRPRAWKPWLQP